MKKRIVIISVVTGLLCVGMVYAAVQGTSLEQPETTEIQITQEEKIQEEQPIPVEEFTLPQTDEDYLNGLIEQGYRADWLEEIYEFWLTCGEDIHMIEEIYQASEERNFTGRYWVEESYNYVTKNAHGVLNLEQITEYSGKSISSDQIQQANILSRRGVYSITEILDQLLEGKSWSELVNEVYGAGTVPENAVGLDMESISKIKKKTGTTPITNVLGSYYEFEEQTAAQDMYGDVIRSVYGDGTGKLICVSKKELGHAKLPKKEKDKKEKKPKKTKEDVLKAGVSKAELEVLGNQYSAETICLAQEIGEKYDKTATEILEENEKTGAWDKLLKEAE